MLTIDEAIGYIKGKLDCMKKCNTFDCLNSDDCDECYFCYAQGTFGEQKEAFEIAIQALEKQGGVSDDLCEPSADKIKVTSLEVIVNGSNRKPYYEIKYKEVGTDNYNIGHSPYNLDLVLDLKEKCFELVKEHDVK